MVDAEGEQPFTQLVLTAGFFGFFFFFITVEISLRIKDC